jgi:hypothetical protein
MINDERVATEEQLKRLPKRWHGILDLRHKGVNVIGLPASGGFFAIALPNAERQDGGIMIMSPTVYLVIDWNGSDATGPWGIVDEQLAEIRGRIAASSYIGIAIEEMGAAPYAKAIQASGRDRQNSLIVETTRSRYEDWLAWLSPQMEGRSPMLVKVGGQGGQIH